MTKSELVDVDCYLRHETDRAICVSLDGDRKGEVWLPKSEVEFEKTGVANVVCVTMPEWLAIRSELV